MELWQAISVKNFGRGEHSLRNLILFLTTSHSKRTCSNRSGCELCGMLPVESERAREREEKEQKKEFKKGNGKEKETNWKIQKRNQLMKKTIDLLCFSFLLFLPLISPPLFSTRLKKLLSFIELLRVKVKKF